MADDYSYQGWKKNTFNVRDDYGDHKWAFVKSISPSFGRDVISGLKKYTPERCQIYKCKNCGIEGKKTVGQPFEVEVRYRGLSCNECLINEILE